MVHLEGHSVVFYNGNFYIFGGIDHVSGVLLNKLYCVPLSAVSTSSGVTNNTGPSSSPRDHSRNDGTSSRRQTQSPPRRGTTNSINNNSLDRYDEVEGRGSSNQRRRGVTAKEVQCRGKIPPPRCFHSCALRGQFMVILGGTLPSGGYHNEVVTTEGAAADARFDEGTTASSSGSYFGNSRRSGGKQQQQQQQQTLSSAIEEMVMYALNLDTFVWSVYYLPVSLSTPSTTAPFPPSSPTGIMKHGSSSSRSNNNNNQRSSNFSTQFMAPRPRCHGTLLSTELSLLMYGGYPADGSVSSDGQGGQKASSSHLPSNHWNMFEITRNAEVAQLDGLVQTSNPMLWGHSAVYVHKCVMLFGGVDFRSGNEVSTLCIYHTDEKRWRWADFALAPEPRALHTAVVVDNSHMIVFGGFCGREDHSPQFNDLWSFSLNTGLWEELCCGGDVPNARSGHAAVEVDGKMYVFAGLETCLPNSGDQQAESDPTARFVENDERSTNTLAILDVASRTWHVNNLHFPNPLLEYQRRQSIARSRGSKNKNRKKTTRRLKWAASDNDDDDDPGSSLDEDEEGIVMSSGGDDDEDHSYGSGLLDSDEQAMINDSMLAAQINARHEEGDVHRKRYTTAGSDAFLASVDGGGLHQHHEYPYGDDGDVSGKKKRNKESAKRVPLGVIASKYVVRTSLHDEPDDEEDSDAAADNEKVKKAALAPTTGGNRFAPSYHLMRNKQKNKNRNMEGKQRVQQLQEEEMESIPAFLQDVRREQQQQQQQQPSVSQPSPSFSQALSPVIGGGGGLGGAGASYLAQKEREKDHSTMSHLYDKVIKSENTSELVRKEEMRLQQEREAQFIAEGERQQKLYSPRPRTQHQDHDDDDDCQPQTDDVSSLRGALNVGRSWWEKKNTATTSSPKRSTDRGEGNRPDKSQKNTGTDNINDDYHDDNSLFGSASKSHTQRFATREEERRKTERKLAPPHPTMSILKGSPSDQRVGIPHDDGGDELNKERGQSPSSRHQQNRRQLRFTPTLREQSDPTQNHYDDHTNNHENDDDGEVDDQDASSYEMYKSLPLEVRQALRNYTSHGSRKPYSNNPNHQNGDDRQHEGSASSPPGAAVSSAKPRFPFHAGGY